MATTLFPDAVITGEVLERLRLPPDHRYELVEGRIESLTPTNSEHARVSATIARLLYNSGDPTSWFILSGDPGVYVRRRPDTVRGPDVLMISRDRYTQRDADRAFLTVAPELVVEVISPSNEPEDIARKVREYVAIGSTVWVVNIEDQSVMVTMGALTARALGAVQTPDGRTLDVDAFFRL
jgi:Uma2 family endonuclease